MSEKERSSCAETSAKLQEPVYTTKRVDSRRHSSRSIKRRKFDDEIVESSLVLKGIKKPEETQDGVGSPDSYDQLASSPIGLSNPADGRMTTSKVHSLLLSTEKRGVMPSIKKKLPSQQRKKLKKTRQAFAAVKDMGRWKPADDIMLIDAVEQLDGLSSVYLAVKFSCQFTLEEIQERWYALLYDPVISSLARQAMKSLPKELIKAAHAKAPFSKAEEKLLSKIPSDQPPTAAELEVLLNENIETFWHQRTPQSLLRHWNLLFQYHLLDDQTVQTIPNRDHVLNFSDADDMLDDTVLSDPKDTVLLEELALADRRQKREIKQLEEENERWKVLVWSVVDANQTSQFDEQTVGVLQGRLVRYLMRSKEITLGRSTSESSVDVDLSLEGPAMKVSRKQGTIKLKKNGEFVLTNTGKRLILVDGKPVSNGSKARLSHNSVVEMALLKFVFIINEELVNSMTAKKISSR